MTNIRLLMENKDYYAEYYSGIRDFTLKYDIDYLPDPDHWIKAGAISIFHRFNPHAFVEEDIPNNTHIRNIKYTDGIESGLYTEDTWQPVQPLKINAGIRFQSFPGNQKSIPLF